MARPEKVHEVESLKEVFENSRSVVLNDFTGLDVEKLSALRKLCREAGIEYRVVKNTLAKRSIVGTPAEELEAHFEGPTALAIARESENVSAKIIAKFAEEHEAPKFKAGIVEGKVIDATELLVFSKLPSKEELLSKLLGCLQAPGNNLASVLQATLRSLLYALNAIVEKGDESGGGTAAEPTKASADTAAEPAPTDAAPADDAAPEKKTADPASEKKKASGDAPQDVEKKAEGGDESPQDE